MNIPYIPFKSSRFVYVAVVLVLSVLLMTAYVAHEQKSFSQMTARSYAQEAPNTYTVTLRIANAADIANQEGKAMSINRPTYWIGNAGSLADSYLGLRFSGDKIPKGAHIRSAAIQVTARRSLWELLNLRIYGETSPVPTSYSSGNYNLSSRQRTFAFTSISRDEPWRIGQQYTFDASNTVQEMADNGFLEQGHANMIIKGEGKRYDYYFIYGNSPVLNVTYSLDVGTVITAVPQPTSTPVPTTVQVTSAPIVTPTSVPATSTGTIWKPTADKPIHWHWQLSEDFQYPRDVVPGATVYDIDGEKTSAQTVAQLHSLGTDVKVICYFDAGVYETYRSDASIFPKSVIGNKDVGWDGSYWVDVRQQDILLPIMKHRMEDWCRAKGFDAIEPDETEVWSNNPGFPITKADNNAYNQAIANLAHSLGFSVALKGNTSEAPELWPYFDLSINEQCFQYKECDNLYSSFLANNKAVMNIEYNVNPDCSSANSHHMNSARRDLNLMGPANSKYLYQPCVANNVNSW